MNSKLFNLSWNDLIKGLIISVLTSVITIAIEQLKNGNIDWNQVGTVTLIATLSYLLKQLGTDENGKTFGIGR